MKLYTFILFFILIFLNSKSYLQEIDTVKTGQSNTQDTISAQTKVVTVAVKDLICRKWTLKESLKNNKRDDFDKTIIEFFPDGKYNYIEEDDSENGVWELKGDTEIIFDKGTKDEETWAIKKIEPEVLVLNFKDEGNYYEYRFIPFR